MWHNIFHSFRLLINPRVFNISVDSSSLNMLSSLRPHLLKIVKRTDVLLKMYNILWFEVFIPIVFNKVDFVI